MFLPALYPELALFCGALIILMSDVFFAKNKPEFFRASYLIALLSCLASLYFTAHNTFIVGSFFHGMFFINSFTCFIKFVTVILLIFVIILSLGFLAKEKEISAEFLALLMISTCGGMFLISANDFFNILFKLRATSIAAIFISINEPQIWQIFREWNEIFYSWISSFWSTTSRNFIILWIFRNNKF